VCCPDYRSHSGHRDSEAGSRQGTSLLNRLLLFNALDMQFRELKLRRDPNVPLREHPTITQLIDYQAFCGARRPPHKRYASDEVTVQELKRALDDPQLGIQSSTCASRRHQIARLNGARLFPLSTLAQRFTQLDRASHTTSTARPVVAP